MDFVAIIIRYFIVFLVYSKNFICIFIFQRMLLPFLPIAPVERVVEEEEDSKLSHGLWKAGVVFFTFHAKHNCGILKFDI